MSTLNNPFWDWAVVGLFYSALQYVDGYLVAKQIPLPTKMDHAKRLTLVQQVAGLKQIFDEYRDLSDESRYARYDPAVQFTQKDVQRLQGQFQKIKAAVRPHL